MNTATTVTSPRDITGRVWSFSAAHTYAAECPRKWSYVHGPHKIRMVDTKVGLTAKRGTVMHAAVRAAYRQADLDGRMRPAMYPQIGTMIAFHETARTALNAAWVNQNLPLEGSTAAELAHEVSEALRELLESQPLPPARGIAEVEERHYLLSPDGLPFVIAPDLVLHDHPRGTLRVRDWKYGDISSRDPERNHQLNLYVMGLAAVYPKARRFVTEFYSMSRRTCVSTVADPDRVMASMRWLEETAARAEADQDPTPAPGPHCTYCPFERICPGPRSV